MAEQVVLWGCGEDGRRLLETQAAFFRDAYVFTAVIDRRQDLWGEDVLRALDPAAGAARAARL